MAGVNANPTPWFRVLPPEEDEEPEFNINQRGPIRMPDTNSPPIAYFYLLFSIELMKEFVRQTNSYANDMCNTARHYIGRKSRKLRWRRNGNLTMFEFKGFLSVLFNMGLIRKVSISEYWNTKSVSQSTPWFRCMFSRNRFQNILKFLRLVCDNRLPNRNNQNYRPAQRFQPLIDFVNRKFLFYYCPRKELSIDESLVGTKGRTAMLQYIPSKRSRFGIKFWMLVEAVTGYILHMKVYEGKKYDPVPNGTLQGSNVVMNLLSSTSLLGKGYHVFVDSFFTSISLVKTLLRHNTYLTGTIRKSGKIPKMIKDAKPKVDEPVFARQGPLLICSYKQNERRRKPVIVVSTNYNALSNTGKPKVLCAYNTFMGGVDLADQMIVTYNDKRKSCRVWKKVLIHIFHRILFNSYILYYQNTDERPPLTRLQFIQSVIDSLAHEHLLKKGNPLTPQPGIRKLQRGKQKDCTVCSDRKHGIRHRARTECVRCKKGLHNQCKRRHVC
ncbi:unnamed protein product [Mytilus edulis]|uniref:PiggyBac transposable element-derived protein domain-containing protein n=1 Tax=Mytilus edulis TaxID=6550 RepID=A0A8S3PVB5_MYTED|nr:unnamed protein product [Mytilus edulis]